MADGTVVQEEGRDVRAFRLHHDLAPILFARDEVHASRIRLEERESPANPALMRLATGAAVRLRKGSPVYRD
jgi:hypothetical protein